MRGFHHFSVAVPVSRCRTLLHMVAFLPFTAVMEWNSLTYFLQNNGILQRQWKYSNRMVETGH